MTQGNCPFRKVWLLDESFPALISATCAQDLHRAAVTHELADSYPERPVWPKTDLATDAPATDTDVLFTTLTPHELARLANGESSSQSETGTLSAPLTQQVTAWENICQPVTYPQGMRMVKAAQVMSRVRRHGLWEQSQTHQSLVPYLLEETYELVDAIDQLPSDPQAVTPSDTEELIGELGDVFLEVLFHAAVGETSPGAAHFDYDDVADSFLRKLRKRMPYAFDGGTFPATIAEQDALWQQSKQHDKAQEATRDTASPLAGILRSQPALALVTQIVERARRAGIADTDIPTEFLEIAALRSAEEGTAEEQLRRRALAWVEETLGNRGES